MDSTIKAAEVVIVGSGGSGSAVVAALELMASKSDQKVILVVDETHHEMNANMAAFKELSAMVLTAPREFDSMVTVKKLMRKEKAQIQHEQRMKVRSSNNWRNQSLKKR